METETFPTQTQSVIINDMLAPIADESVLPDVNSECSVTSLTAPTATDNCFSSITGTHDTVFPISTQGTTIVTWTYDDGNGNTTTQTQNVTITDTTAPIAVLGSLADVNSECSVTSLLAPTAMDNCTGSITGVHDAELPIVTQGTTVVMWTYTDGSGNTSSQSQNVVINDVTPAVADAESLLDINSECSISSLVAPTATDNCSGIILGTPNVSFPITTQGSFTVTWTFTDDNGNTSTQSQNVIINDQTDPVVDNAILAPVTSECDLIFLEAPTATDNCAGTLTGVSNTAFPIINSSVVLWTFNDGNGNSSTQTQTVTITGDTTSPLADSESLSDVTAECSVSLLTAPTATDDCSGSVVGTHNASLPITTQGITTITWTFDDGNGNTSTQTQDVVIVDSTAPVADLANLSEITAECEVTLTSPTASDNCSGTIMGVSDVSFPITSSGTTSVIWTYTDGNGNISTQAQNVIIISINDGITQSDAGVLSAEAAGYTYQWIDCANGNAPVSGATSQSYTPIDEGSYACEISNGECTVTSACLTSTVGVEESDLGSALAVYPNPTSGDISIDLGKEYPSIQVTIYNSLGQLVLEKREFNSSLIPFSLEDESGVYTVIIQTEEGKSARVRVVKG